MTGLLEPLDVGDGLLLGALEGELRGSRPASRTIAAKAAASKRGSSRLAGVRLTAPAERGELAGAPDLVELAGPLEDRARSRNTSSSIERSVSMAAWTIDEIDCGSIGMSGRNRHSYSWSAPVASSTIGWNATPWSLRRLKK